MIEDDQLAWDRVRLTVVIPAYNESRTVETLLRRVREVPLWLEVIVVDDGSTDGTRELLLELEDTLIDRLIFHEQNRGKGAALRRRHEPDRRLEAIAEGIAGWQPDAALNDEIHLELWNADEAA